MKNTERKFVRARTAVSLLALALLAGGCAGKKEEAAGFATPEAAVAALVTAFEKDDTAALARLLGPGTEDLLSSGDPVADKTDRADFLASYKLKNSLAADGADEVIYRRVGENELGAIDVMYGYVNAQNGYASEGRDGDPAGIYALKLHSDEGMHNGLYWPTAEGEPPSPAGPFIAGAAAEGYAAGKGGTPYHGYYYRMLYAQGANANGGAREYFKDGVLTEGFAGIAWPADYGASGVMTFIVNHDGVVFQKDLGEDTATAVETIQKFDPDSTWTAIVPLDLGSEAPATTEAAPAS